jgi:phosphoribosylaminoimidazole carboxylase PurE protein
MAELHPLVGILMGSDSDWEKIQPASDTLAQFGVRHEVRVLSAHRTPRAAEEFAATARSRGLRVLICAAGGAAHLGGVVAAHSTLPVIGIPVAGGAFNGMDALLATVQMPAGVPVATVAVGSAGPVNAAILAVEMLAISDAALAAALERHRETLARKVEEGNARVQQTLAGSQHA